MNDVTILRSPDQIEEASMAQLLATYNALTGRTPDGEGTKRSVTKFESREAGKRRVEKAMMAAKDADAHLGVPKGAEGEVKTAEELAAKAEAKGQPAPDTSEPGAVIFPDGTLANKLQQEAAAAGEPITPRPRATPQKQRDPDAPRAGKVTHVRLGSGRSKVRADSARGVVLSGMAALTKGKPEVVVTVDALSTHCGIDVRGPVQKLIEVGHLVPAAPPAPAAA